MRRKVTLIIIIFLIITISIILIYSKEEKEIMNNNEETKNNFISMMLENDNGEYEEKKDITFPKENYIFNPEASSCENGGILSWNKEKGKIEASLITSDKCYAYFDKYDFTKSCLFGYEDNFACELIKNKDDTLIYHDGKCDYEGEANCDLEAGDFSYRFTGSDYKIKAQYQKKYVDITKLIMGFYNSDTKQINYTIAYDDTVKNTFLDAIDKTIEDGYVVKDEIKNFVCFNTSEIPCPESNLYRVIGIIDKKVKLIKSSVATSNELGTTGAYKNDNYYVRNSLNTSNAWTDSDLNTENLNNYYFNNYLLPKWRDKIAEYTWKVGKNSWTTMVDYDAKTVYNEEIVNNPENYSLGKIGLFYVSDYMYSMFPDYWLYRAGHDYDAGNNFGQITGGSWLFLDAREYTISSDETNALIKYETGAIGSTNVNSGLVTIRPVFFLKENVELSSGDGSFNNPYRLKI